MGSCVCGNVDCREHHLRRQTLHGTRVPGRARHAGPSHVRASVRSRNQTRTVSGPVDRVGSRGSGSTAVQLLSTGPLLHRHGGSRGDRPQPLTCAETEHCLVVVDWRAAPFPVAIAVRSLASCAWSRAVRLLAIPDARCEREGRVPGAGGVVLCARRPPLNRPPLEKRPDGVRLQWRLLCRPGARLPSAGVSDIQSAVRDVCLVSAASSRACRREDLSHPCTNLLVGSSRRTRPRDGDLLCVACAVGTAIRRPERDDQRLLRLCTPLRGPRAVGAIRLGIR